MRRLTFGILLGLAPLLWGCAEAEMPAPEARAGAEQAVAVAPQPAPIPPVTDGWSTIDGGGWPWTAIGRINRASGGFCTGTLVGPRVVLTAASCVRQPSGAPMHPQDLHFLAGYNREQYVAHARGQRIILPEDAATGQISGAEIFNAWALIELEETLAITPIALADATDLAAPGLSDHLAKAAYRPGHEYVLSGRSDCGRPSGALAGGLLVHDCRADAGETGAPILLMRNGTVRVAGIDVARTTETGIAVAATSVDREMRLVRR